MIRYYENKECGGITGWNWIESDIGAWDGPKRDWEDHHYHKIKDHVTDFRTVIQAGGNQGMYPRLLSRMFERVITFEPDPLNFKTLVTNCDNDNIIKIQGALGDHNGYCEIHRHSMQNTGMHQTKVNSTGMIPMFMLDLIIPSNAEVDLLMLDLEGFEIHALTGAMSLIKKNKPVIFAERPTNEVYSLLDRLGYTGDCMSAMDVIFVAS